MSAKAAVETYNIDPVHTWVGFSIAHFFTKVPGYFSKVTGTIRACFMLVFILVGFRLLVD